MATIAGALASLLVSLPPSSASAACIDPAMCICSPVAVESALIVKVSSAGEAQIEGVVSTVFTRPGETSVFAEGDTVTLPEGSVPSGPPDVGEELLVVNQILDSGETDFRVVSIVDADGTITCQYAPDYQPEAAKAAELALSDTCMQQVNAEIGPIDCNDTVSPLGCSMPGNAPSGSGSAWAALGALGFAAAAATRRRRKAAHEGPR